MLDSVYIATTGLQSFSKGLDVIGDNVTNVNTVGYKTNSLVYEDVHYHFNLKDERGQTLIGAQLGSGVAAGVTSVQFAQGDLQRTGNDLDAAIYGRGFFIVDRNGEHVYTRAGQFDFNDDGDLVTRNDNYRVLGITDSGALQPINREALRTMPGKVTSEVSFIGNISTGSGTTTINNVAVIDSLGVKHTMKIVLTLDTTKTRTWLVTVIDETSKTVASNGVIAFQSNGSPAEGFNTFTFSYTPTGAAAQSVTLDFGDPGSFVQATAFSNTSDVKMDKQDGYAAGSLVSLTFDEKGRLLATYSNQKTQLGAQLALADFNNMQALQQIGGALFRAQSAQQVFAGRAGEKAFGSVVGGNIEGSSVDLSQQFGDMIIIQRGYQASSQVLTAANEMIQQLLEISKK